MTFDRSLLPEPTNFYESQGLKLKGPRQSKWKTSECRFHGGSDSMRINVTNGAFRCMNCGASGGDVLAYQMADQGQDFIKAAKALGAWREDGHQTHRLKPTALSPRMALEVLQFESTLTAVAAGNLANGCVLTDTDRARLRTCARRISKIAEDFSS